MAAAALVHELQQTCLWDDLPTLARGVIESVEAAEAQGSVAGVSPFGFVVLPIVTTAQQQLHCARQWAARQLKPAIKSQMPPRPSGSRSKLKIGYLSADYHYHATAMLVAELFEKHDRRRFDIIGYSYGRPDDSPLRRRLERGLDQFVDLRAMSHTEAARRIAADQIDILVDLKGYTVDSRTQILADRPAPIQVNYLGFPGTMGAPFIDYILVDEFIVPSNQQPYYTERLVHLPGCYQVNDSRREIAPSTPSRRECGLPDGSFVFCSFNNNYKITPEMFDVWTRLLQAIPRSVLWLLESNPTAAANLRREAATRGVPPQRLVFAQRLRLEEHLARHRLADLFLDTFPVNAHTTASEALWSGCPLVTLAGETLVSRVAGSLLRALDMPELITTSFDQYEQVARQLASDTNRLAELRQRLAINRTTAALFDGKRFTLGLEQAYETMWATYIAGQPPCSFAVTAEV
jgi:protein O-GlcNAc transferase